MNQACRRYLIGLSCAMLVYVAVVWVSVTFIKAYPDSAWRIPIAFSPMLPAFFALVSILRYFRTLDELHRRIQFEALALSFATTAFLALGYGFLQNAGFPPLDVIWVTPFMTMLWGLAAAFFRRRYQ